LRAFLSFLSLLALCPCGVVEEGQLILAWVCRVNILAWSKQATVKPKKVTKCLDLFINKRKRVNGNHKVWWESRWAGDA